VYLPQFSGAVIACNILKERDGIAPPVYFLGSGTCCSEGGIYGWGVPSPGSIFIINLMPMFTQMYFEYVADRKNYNNNPQKNRLG
jgi:hypothetical protein